MMGIAHAIDMFLGNVRTLMGLLPLLVDLVVKRAAVFGAGPVGVRKSNYLVQEAEVAVIALHFTEGLDPKARTVKADAREVMDEWLDWADLVVAATDDHELNALLAAKASSGEGSTGPTGLDLPQTFRGIEGRVHGRDIDPWTLPCDVPLPTAKAGEGPP